MFKVKKERLSMLTHKVCPMCRGAGSRLVTGTFCNCDDDELEKTGKWCNCKVKTEEMPCNTCQAQGYIKK